MNNYDRQRKVERALRRPAASRDADKAPAPRRTGRRTFAVVGGLAALVMVFYLGRLAAPAQAAVTNSPTADTVRKVTASPAWPTAFPSVSVPAEVAPAIVSGVSLPATSVAAVSTPSPAPTVTVTQTATATATATATVTAYATVTQTAAAGPKPTMPAPSGSAAPTSQAPAPTPPQQG